MTTQPEPSSDPPPPSTKGPLPCEPGFSDHVYKTVDGVECPLRLWPAEGDARGAPFVLWIHGGSFTGGKWSSPTAWVVPAFRSRGYHLVSVGYRMLPHVGFTDIVADGVDAYNWCSANLPSLLGGSSCGVVAGPSAGGTLALLVSATLVETGTPPLATVNVYGMTDVFDPSHTTTLPFDPGPYLTGITEDELVAMLAERDPAGAWVQTPWAADIPPALPLEVTRAHLGLPDYTPTIATLRRLDLITYMISKRIMLRTLHRRETCDEAEFQRRLHRWNPNELIVAVKTYPPTFILHGTADQYVPIREALATAKILREKGVAVGEVHPEGMDHCFDWDIASPEDEGWDECIVPLLDFVDEHARPRANGSKV